MHALAMVEEREPVEVSEEDYEQARYDHRGWCPACEEFTTSGVAARDSGRSCVSCLDDGVSGVGHAVSAGFVRVAS